MNLEIKPFTPDLADDYFDFHDHHAFSDHAEWSHCYCITFCKGITIDQAMPEESKNDEGGEDASVRAHRKRAEACISSGALQGYVAYADGLLVGWCNANDKATYARFDFDEEMSDFIRRSGDGRIKSVLCFCVAPSYRGKGIAAALLEKVLRDAKKRGYTAVEGYPRLHEKCEPFDFTGPFHLWEKMRFVKVAEKGNVSIMRYIL